MVKLCFLLACTICGFWGLAKAIRELPLSILPNKYVYGYYISLFVMCGVMGVTFIFPRLDTLGIDTVLIFMVFATLHCFIRRNMVRMSVQYYRSINANNEVNKLASTLKIANISFKYFCFCWVLIIVIAILLFYLISTGKNR